MTDDRTIAWDPDEDPSRPDDKAAENGEGTVAPTRSLDGADTRPGGPPPQALDGSGRKTIAAGPGDRRSGGRGDRGGRELGRIGPYRLVRQIGEGGMGLVYEAEQLQPIRRRVALKMVKRGMDTDEFIARFESERQALAMMDHPCIAKVFDAGATERGRPFLAMEYVAGIPLNDYCDEHRLTVRERLELFINVCDGVQHAHQKAVIHRDLKPSNVLVTVIDGQPVPKIIDFGVAKATDRTLFESTLTTSAGQLVGTPEYMSPEQADFDSTGIDTRTDVYALGVMLYEMLVGRLPFTSEEFQAMGFKEALRTIKEVEPPRPSTRLGTLAREKDAGAIAALAAKRKAGPAALRRELKGDLDWITMKALEKERDRRYESAHALAMDIGRHLAFQPVVAGPPSTTYRMRKFARRNRTWVATGALVMTAVILGIFGTTTGLIRAVRAEKQARVDAQTAREVSDFMVDLFEVSDPDQSRGNTITAREILDSGARRIEEELAGQPTTQARLMNVIGRVYRNLGLYEQAGRQLEAALDLRRNRPDVPRRDLAASLADLGELDIRLARYDEAEKMLLDALELMRGTDLESSLEVAQSLNQLASIYRRQEDFARAEPLYERAREIRIARLGPDAPEVASSENSLAILNYFWARYDAAEEHYRRALDIWERAYGEDHADVAKALNNLGVLYEQQDRFVDAEPLYERASAIYEHILGPEHPRTLTGLNNLALCRYEQGKFAGVGELYRRVIAISRKVLGDEHPDLARTLNNLANLYREQGRYAAADSLYEAAYAIRVAVLGFEHSDVAWSVRDIGLLRLAEGRPAEAATALERALAILERSMGPSHPDLVDPLGNYADILDRLGRAARADSVRQVAAAIESLRADH